MRLLLLGISQFLLTACQLLQLLQRFINLFRALFGCCLLAGFKLILFGIEFQVEQAFQFTAGASTTTAASAPAIKVSKAERCRAR